MIHDIFDISGNSPLVPVKQLARQSKARFFAKLEYMNPCCTHYCRVASAIVRDAEDRGVIHPGMTLVDWTFGTSGIALAMAGITRGYKLLLVAPDRICREKQEVLRALGAEMVLTPSDALPGDPRSCVAVAENLVRTLPNAWFANMYENPVSLNVHEQNTGPEIFRQTGGKVTHVYVPMASAAMISGIGRHLKSVNPLISIIGVEPVGSTYHDLHAGRPAGVVSAFELEDIGAVHLTPFWDPSVIDRIVQVDDAEAFNCGRELLRAEAVFAGGASGAAMAAALGESERLGDGSLAVVMMTDFGAYDLSRMYNDEWMRQKGYYRRSKSSLDQITAADILQRKVRKDLIFALPEQTLSDVFEMMKQNDVSQMPIVSYGSPIGSISENKILSILIENDAAMNGKVVSFMEKPFPVCQSDATISELSEKLQKNASGVLITLNDDRLQLITKSDLIDALTHK
ncbi:MAG: pyridoxal-phosphate dependent enzyme [Chlorobiaceae bacterium]|nr:pyridoxal-phosphate dependent enzyme [Chlorobiaceae bacterium]NTW74838.1 pyridoxal-phosphate dependent enzyme [Chlorobiaceae bacterium]